MYPPLVIPVLALVGAAVLFGIFGWFFPIVALAIVALLYLSARTNGRKDLTP